jgi:hypothetical protein
MIACPFCHQELEKDKHVRCGLLIAYLNQKLDDWRIILWIHDIIHDGHQYQPQWFVGKEGIYKFRLYDLKSDDRPRLMFELSDGVENITPSNINDKLSLLLLFQ